MILHIEVRKQSISEHRGTGNICQAGATALPSFYRAYRLQEIKIDGGGVTLFDTEKPCWKGEITPRVLEFLQKTTVTLDSFLIQRTHLKTPGEKCVLEIATIKNAQRTTDFCRTSELKLISE